MIAAPLVLVAACIIGIPTYRALGIDYVRAMAAHHAVTALTFNLVVGGMALLLLAVTGLAGQIAAKRRGLGRTAGILTILGLLGPVFFNGVYFGGFQLAGGPAEAAAGTLIDQAQIIPSNVINLAGPALIVGFILLAVGAAKAGVLGRRSACALGVTCIIPLGFISGFLAISAVGFVGTAIGLVPLGVRTLRS